ncbi:MAG TPA: hypothetical protein PKZ32_13060 [Candidatus Melainabacteria bacterium]|nr:hypothetical protein [Candidatus Melainabacteria bacterium]
MTPPGRVTDSSVKTSDLVADFGAAAFDSAIQKPINGLTQLTGKLTGHELPQLSLVETAKGTTGSEVFAQQAGSAVGMLVPFLGTRALVRSGLGGRLGTGYAAAAAEGGLTGLAMGTVLTPVENGQPFWQTRLANGLTDAGTFSVLNIAAKGVGSMKSLAVTGETSVLGRIGKGAVAGSLAGLPAGFAHAELNSITHGKGAAGAAEIAGDMTGFALFGGLLGGASGMRSNHRLLSAKDAPAAQKSGATAEIPVTKPPEPPVTVSEAGRVNAPREAVKADSPVLPEGTRVYTTEEMLRIVQARESAALRPTEKPAETVLRTRREGYIDGGDEGKVYTNYDGSVTKVYHDKGRSMEDGRAMYEQLQAIGIRTPKILEIGKTPEGQPALRMEQIGDGDSLRFQLMMREIQGDALKELGRQYWGFADTLKKAGIRIDWNLKNMRFEDGKLYILDPSFLKRENFTHELVEMFGKGIPKPESMK